ncbi:hypothetical protein AMR42_07405 [Limnothrix sp. PR1529]|nr:hypothetical protein BCR12_01840 [Limnothrix sp. P13C2]PIB14147.1 hypothetical protein AMR42_07405 [Limnothrix sp. PR1529]
MGATTATNASKSKIALFILAFDRGGRRRNGQGARAKLNDGKRGSLALSPKQLKILAIFRAIALGCG